MIDKNEIYIRTKVIRIRSLLRMRSDGGPGSGNFNHEGRKGEVGGSAPGGGSGGSTEKKSSSSREKKEHEEKFPHNKKKGEDVVKLFEGPVTKEALDYCTYTDALGEKTCPVTIVDSNGVMLERNLDGTFTDVTTGDLFEAEDIIGNPDYRIGGMGGITKEIADYASEKGYEIDSSFVQVNPYVTEEMLFAYRDAEEIFPEIRSSGMTFMADDSTSANAYVRWYPNGKVDYAMGGIMSSDMEPYETEQALKGSETPLEEYGGMSWSVQTPEYISGAYRVSMHEIGHVVQSKMDHWFDGCDARAIANYKDFMHDRFYNITEMTGANEGKSVYSDTNEDEKFAEGFAAYACGAETPFADTTGKMVRGWRRVFGNMSRDRFNKMWTEPWDPEYDIYEDLLRD